ncbi:hypothetical protein EYF80_049849 [Liparis tanakae]|uniref:Uncharacterized protein n=1 Tax=Liparis tanakae TaxID=230148 RepID=A0A4Z2FGT2_9TELE|nr:hypothetical protein EYF80_049849 [Liparis tanakae]
MEARVACSAPCAVPRGRMRERNCARVSWGPSTDTHVAKNPSGSSRPTSTSRNVFLTNSLPASRAAAEGDIFKCNVTLNRISEKLQKCTRKEESGDTASVAFTSNLRHDHRVCVVILSPSALSSTLPSTCAGKKKLFPI